MKTTLTLDADHLRVAVTDARRPEPGIHSVAHLLTLLRLGIEASHKFTPQHLSELAGQIRSAQPPAKPNPAEIMRDPEMLQALSQLAEALFNTSHGSAKRWLDAVHVAPATA